MRGALLGGLTELDLAKYPFLKAASAYVANMGLDLSDLTSPALSGAVSRALKRIYEAVRSGKISFGEGDEIEELLSFPIAIAIVASVGHEYLKRRYALAEAKRAEELLSGEPAEKLLVIARELGWRIRPVQVVRDGALYEFSVGVPDYLRNAAGLKDKRWKLINRLVVAGEVLVTRAEVARLLAEEARRRVEELLSRPIRVPPGPLSAYVEKVKALLSQLKLGEAPRLEAAGEVEFEAFPPCMRVIYAALSERKHVPHAGRFAFTAFLLHIGMSVDEIVELFKQVADFSEKITRYQVEHIAGQRGGKVRYTPPSCDTMRSYGLCVGADELCARVRHPLTYYARKLRRLRRARRARQEAKQGQAEGQEGTSDGREDG